ncbi:MAG: DUF1659 domain-containing protein [Bacillota bacterium]
MPVVSTISNSTLKMVVATGMDEAGNPILRGRAYNKVKPLAADQGIFDAALALAGLGTAALHGVERIDTKTLVEIP